MRDGDRSFHKISTPLLQFLIAPSPCLEQWLGLLEGLGIHSMEWNEHKIEGGSHNSHLTKKNEEISYFSSLSKKSLDLFFYVNEKNYNHDNHRCNHQEKKKFLIHIVKLGFNLRPTNI